MKKTKENLDNLCSNSKFFYYNYIFSHNKKKTTDIQSVEVETRDSLIDGVMMADKVGEVKFINIEKLIAGQDLEDETEKEELATVLFGH